MLEQFQRDIRVEPVGTGVLFDLTLCFERSACLSARRNQALRCVRTHLRRMGSANHRGQREEILFTGQIGACVLERLVETLAELLANVAYRPLTPRELLQLLPISKAERVRWTKDGRLPQSGSVWMRKADLIAVPTYSSELVERLRQRLDLIEAWRLQDGG